MIFIILLLIFLLFIFIYFKIYKKKDNFSNQINKIKIVMFYDDAIKNYSILSEKINKIYTNKHNYDLIVYNESFDKNRAPQWNKVMAVLKTFEKYPNTTAIIWIDSDAIFNMHSIKIESFLDKYKENIIIADDKMHGHLDKSGIFINTGVMIFRNTKWVINLLNKWWDYNGIYLKQPLHEQQVLNDMLNNNILDCKKNIKIVPANEINSISQHYTDTDFIWHLMATNNTKREEIFKYKLLEKEKENENNPPFPIDIVYTWAGENNEVNNIRTSNNDELMYSLRGVEQYLPWVNRIFILMNPPKKIPSWFKNDYNMDKIIIVDHYDTFDSSDNHIFLPTTNSNSIETTLHKIPELSEHFIYFNDDIFVTQKLSYTHFFTSDGKPILTTQMNYKTVQKFNFPPTIIGIYSHIPFPILKSQMKKFTEIYSEFINIVRINRNDVGCDICQKYELACPCMQLQGTLGVFMTENGMTNLKYFDENSKYLFGNDNIDKLINNLSNLPPIICIQDGDKNINTRKDNIDKTKQILNKIFPNKASFEKNSIPKKIISTYYDKNKIPIKVINNIKKFASNYEYIVFDDDEIIDFLKNFYPTNVLDAFYKLEGAHKADLFRYCYLYIYGGVYLDIKTELIQDLDNILNKNNIELYTVLSIVSNTIYQGIIVTIPNNKIFLELIDFIINIKKPILKTNYLIFTQDFYNNLEKYNKKKLEKGFNNNNVYLFYEICNNNSLECGGKLDRYGLCCYVYDEGKKIIKTRYSEYPW